MSAVFAHALDVASEALTFLFAAEVALKLLGLGTWGFASDAFNVFDLVVVATGVLELALTVGEAACSGNRRCRKQYAPVQRANTSTQPSPCPLLCPLQMGANGNALRSFRTLRILRSFRVLRVLKVGRRLREAGAQLGPKVESIPKLSVHTFLGVMHADLLVFGQPTHHRRGAHVQHVPVPGCRTAHGGWGGLPGAGVCVHGFSSSQLNA